MKKQVYIEIETINLIKEHLEGSMVPLSISAVIHLAVLSYTGSRVVALHDLTGTKSNATKNEVETSEQGDECMNGDVDALLAESRRKKEKAELAQVVKDWK
tara:strand:+ start:2101 stop:2403 length:303 start_codon:yes stop_codon:yes gene_type:complete